MSSSSSKDSACPSSGSSIRSRALAMGRAHCPRPTWRRPHLTTGTTLPRLRRMGVMAANKTTLGVVTRMATPTLTDTRRHKIEFQKFEGVDDPLRLVNRCEWYFRLRSTPEHKKVQHTLFYLLDDAQMWYHRLELNDGPPSWNHFIQLVQIWFGPPLTDNPIDELALLRREVSVDDFCTRFMSLSCCDPAILEDHQIQLLMAGLGQPLRMNVAL
jgi:hypothetical protein